MSASGSWHRAAVRGAWLVAAALLLSLGVAAEALYETADFSYGGRCSMGVVWFVLAPETRGVAFAIAGALAGLGGAAIARRPDGGGAAVAFAALGLAAALAGTNYRRIANGCITDTPLEAQGLGSILLFGALGTGLELGVHAEYDGADTDWAARPVRHPAPDGHVLGWFLDGDDLVITRKGAGPARIAPPWGRRWQPVDARTPGPQVLVEVQGDGVPREWVLAAGPGMPDAEARAAAERLAGPGAEVTRLAAADGTEQWVVRGR